MMGMDSFQVNTVSMDEERSWRALHTLNALDERLRAFQIGERLVISTPYGQQVWHRFGSPHNEPLVLLHGGSGSWLHWVSNVVSLSSTRCVYAMDLPSMGDSDLPAGVMDADDLTPALELGFRALFKGAAVSVMGFSFGGLCAGLLASQVPSLFKELILVGAPGLGLFGPPLKLRGLTPGMDESQVLAVMKHNLKVMMVSDEACLDEFTLHLQLKNVSRDRLRRRRLARTDVMLTLQASWTCPVHTVWGERDVLFKGRLGEVQGLLNRCDLRTHTLIEGAGHWVMHEKSQAFNEHIKALLN
jgi:pimeloyl-ACP methyl ester carboxylesterase